MVFHAVAVQTSPEIEARRIEDEKFERDNTLHSCCNGSTDKRLLEYSVKTVVIMICLAFALTMLVIDALGDDPCNPLIPFYTGIITLVLGLYVTPPSKK